MSWNHYSIPGDEMSRSKTSRNVATKVVSNPAGSITSYFASYKKSLDNDSSIKTLSSTTIELAQKVAEPVYATAGPLDVSVGLEAQGQEDVFESQESLTKDSQATDTTLVESENPVYSGRDSIIVGGSLNFDDVERDDDEHAASLETLKESTLESAPLMQNLDTVTSLFGEDDDESPVCRKRSLLFDESFKAEKFKCDEYIQPKTAPKPIKQATVDDYNYDPKTDVVGDGTLTVGSEPLLPLEQSVDCAKDEEIRLYLNCPASKKSQCFRDYVSSFFRYGSTFQFPPWIDVHQIRDIDGNSPLDPQYDPSTLWVPPKKHKWAIQYRSGHFTDCMQQWWYLKQTRFDSLLFFKMGKFYELFYHDACIIQEICSLRWMGMERKPHVGFPERSIHTYAKACVDRGYRVVVVEQTETPTELESRIKQGGATVKAVERQVCEVITPGTIVRSEMLTAQSRPLLVIETSEKMMLNVAIVDVSMCKIKLASLEFDVKDLTTLIYGINPAEIVLGDWLHQHAEFRQYTSQAGIPVAVLGMPAPGSDANDVDFSQLSRCQCDREDLVYYTKILKMVKLYLSSVLLDKIIEYCSIEVLDLNLQSSEYMTMDAVAMSHLEIFKSQEGSEEMCLYSFLNKTSNAIGERRLRQWLLKPLQDASAINQRSGAVELLVNNISLVLDFKEDMSQVPDIERVLGKIVNAAANAYKGAIYFDESIYTKMHDLYSLLNSMISLENVVDTFLGNCKDIQSDLEDTVLQVYAGSFVSVTSECNSIKAMLQVTGVRQCCSKVGCWEASDGIRDEIKLVEEKLKDMLARIKNTAPSASFVNCKYRYEIEVTEKEYNVLKKSQNLEISSTRSGFIRFRTPAALKFVEELESLEFKLEQAELSYFEHVVKQVNTRFLLFAKLVDLAADLDCLCSLALVAKNSKMPMTRAKILPKRTDSFMEFKSLVHPLVYDLHGNFVPNDISLNCNDVSPIILLTGPNMGGKSTLLRQTALAVVMAQIGSLVPAEYCEFTVVDGIYTRLGSSDNIIQGQSTFLMELQDMSNMLNRATPSSLCLIDELGRGTSTFDGTAIAVACLEKIASMGTRSIFTSHFKFVVEAAQVLSNVTLCHMSYAFDKEQQTLEFLYKLAPGACAESHGYVVAKFAGIPDKVVEMAQEIGNRFKAGMSKVYKHGPELEAKIRGAYINGDVEELMCLFNRYKDNSGV